MQGNSTLRQTKNIVNIDTIYSPQDVLPSDSIYTKTTDCWEFEEGSGTLAIGVKGANQLTATGAPTWPVGKVGNYATELNGTTQYWDGGAGIQFLPGGIGGTGDFAFCCWVYADSATGPRTIVMTGSNSWFLPNNFFTIDLNASKLRILGISGYVSSVDNFPTAQWVFVWARRNGNTLEAGWTPASTSVFDTSAKVTTSITGLTYNRSAFLVGVFETTNSFGPPTYSNYFDGRIDEIIWANNGDYLDNTELTTIFGLGNGNPFEKPYATKYGKWDVSTKNLTVWGFNEGTGTSAYDRGGLRNLTATGAPSWSTGLLNGCSVLNGTTQWWDGGDQPEFEPGTGDFTYCGWFNMDMSFGDITQYVLYKQAAGATSDRLRMAKTFDGLISPLYLSIGNTAYAYGTTNMGAYSGKWIFIWLRRKAGVVAAGFSAAESGVFNTMPEITLNDTSSVGVNASTFRIGSNPSGTDRHKGSIDQLIWCKGYAFSDLELTGLFNKGLGTERLRGYTVEIPQVAGDKTSFYSLEDAQVYASNSLGVQQLTGGYKFGELFGAADDATASGDDINFTKVVPFQDCIITHLAFRLYITTANARIVAGMYDNYAGTSSQYIRPRFKLFQTDEYIAKISDTDSIILIPLREPYHLDGGKTYWVAYNQSAECHPFRLVGGDEVYGGLRYTTGYSSYLPDEITFATALTASKTLSVVGV